MARRVTPGKKVDKYAMKRSRATVCEMGLLTSQFLSHLAALLHNESLYTLDGDKLLE